MHHRLSIFLTIALVCISLYSADVGGAISQIQLDPPIQFHEGRGPSLVAHGKSFALLYSRSAGEGKGGNLFFRPSLQSSVEIRVNDIAGEVRDGSENSPLLLRAPDDTHLYAVWNATDTRHPLVNRLRFSEWTDRTGRWSKAITISDDVTISTQMFQGAGVAPDGAVHVAWVDRREASVGRPGDDSGEGHHTHPKLRNDTAVLYTARWTGGSTFEKNVRVAESVCPCRIAVGFANGKVLLAWRSVDRNNVRDIAVSSSADGGLSWTSPRVAVQDGWRINECPQDGPSLTTVGEVIYLAWMTRGNRGSGVFAATSKDTGLTFGPVEKLSSARGNATHPYLVAGKDYAVVVLQWSVQRENAHSHDHSSHTSYMVHTSHVPLYSDAALISVLRHDGAPGPVLRIAASGLIYPNVAVAPNGEVAVAWTQAQNGQMTGWLATGKLHPEK